MIFEHRSRGIAALALLAASPAFAKPARCFSTDDGYYACDFQATDRKGSFSVSAPQKPTYTLEVDEPGFAFGYLDLGNRSIALPGRFLRSGDDPACWANPETDVRLCAW